MKMFYFCSILGIGMPQRTFGGAHTRTKLDLLQAYLHAYTRALKKQPFRLIYVDAFAGTGDIPLSEHCEPSIFQGDDYQPFIAGSADRALRIAKPFDSYVFVERSKHKIKQLDTLRSLYPELAGSIEVVHGDANAQLVRFCSERDWKKNRAVVFLDPFGNQVEWGTICAIARTQAIDLWYLFPAGLGVHRQIGRDGSVDTTHDVSLDRLFGTTDWRDVFVEQRSEPDLFSEQRSVTAKSATPESITRYMIKRMKPIFAGGVLDEWLALGSRNIHMYSLLFAWANPSHKASLAGKLARAVLRSKQHGRP